MLSREDTPRATFRLFSWRVNAVVIALLGAVAAFAWYHTVVLANAMARMVMGLGQIGYRHQGDMSAGIFLAMWAIMMTAMMLPTAAPMVLAHLAVARRRGDGIFSTIAFVAGYLLVWSAIGIVPLFAYWQFAALDWDPTQPQWLPALASTILITAGAYQFTTWKVTCLSHCISPFAFVVMHDFEGGVEGAVRAGIIHGAYCLGCCWAMLVVLIVVGLMNLLWMGLVFAILMIEKHWRRGIVVARIVGGALIALGYAIIFKPLLLALISR